MSINNKKWREKNGRLIHDADCFFWGKEICTCGLIHHLNPECPDAEWFWKEWGAHERQLERIPEPLPFSAELLNDPRYDVLAIIKARLRERLTEKLAEEIARECADDILMVYGDPAAPKPRGLIIAAEAI